MIKKILFLAILMPVFIFSRAQSPISQDKLSESLVASANQMAALYRSGDYKGYITYIHPVLIQGAGGEAKMLGILNQQSTQFRNQGVVINSIIFNQPTAIVSAKNELQSTISQHLN